MGRNISIQDIAQVAGVSHTTVSRALRDSPLISQEVRDTIQRMAREMGYVPNAVAQSLRGQRTNTIGLVVTTIADPFVGRVVRGIEEIAQKNRLSLLLSVSNNDPDVEVDVIENFHRRRVDGVILAATRITSQHEKRLARLNVPTVLINQQSETALDLLNSVSIDDYGGARQGMDHLIQLGHRAIGYIGAGNRPRSNRRRTQAYLDAMCSAGIQVPDDWLRVAPSDHRFHLDDVIDGQSLLPDLIDAGVTAVFCYNDMIAVGVTLACHGLGISVPAQFSILGFDDIELAQLVHPPLTTVHQPKLRLGQMAMEMLLDLLANQPVQDSVLPTELFVRGSTAVAPGTAPRNLLVSPRPINPGNLFTPPL